MKIKKGLILPMLLILTATVFAMAATLVIVGISRLKTATGGVQLTEAVSGAISGREIATMELSDKCNTYQGGTLQVGGANVTISVESTPQQHTVTSTAVKDSAQKVLTKYLPHLPIEGWAKLYGQSGTEYINAIIQTADGGYLLGGSTDSFGAGNEDAFLIKTDSEGEILWAKVYGGSSIDRIESMQETQDGGYILGGYTNSFGLGQGDYLAIKTDGQGFVKDNTGDCEPTGSIKCWAKVYGTPQPDSLYSILETPTADGYILGGYFSTVSATDCFVFQTDADGILDLSTWPNLLYGGTGALFDICYSMEVVPSGGYILSGYRYQSGGGADWNGLIFKLNNTLTIDWTAEIAHSGNDVYFWDAKQTSDGGYIAAGYSGPIVSSWDGLVLKLDSSPSLEWAIRYGGANSDLILSLSEEADGYSFGGRTSSFGNGSNDFFLINTDETGAVNWAKTYGGTQQDIFRTFQPGYVLTGYGSGDGWDALVANTGASGNIDCCGFNNDITGSIVTIPTTVVITTPISGFGQQDVEALVGYGDSDITNNASFQVQEINPSQITVTTLCPE